jgi:hypothetical protein
MHDLGPPLVLLTMIAAAAVLIIWSLTLRYRRQELKHKERMAALEKGAELPAEPTEPPRKPWSPRIYLLRGLIWLFSGIGLSVFLLGAILTSPVREQTLEERLSQAQNLRHQGASEDDIKQFLSSKEQPHSDHLPAGFALIGLIPAGVGLAYVIYYRGENRPEAG